MAKKKEVSVNQSYLKQRLNKGVTIVLNDGKKIVGILREVTKYEICLDQVKEKKLTGKTFIICKHSIKYIRYTFEVD